MLASLLKAFLLLEKKKHGFTHYFRLLMMRQLNELSRKKQTNITGMC